MKLGAHRAALELLEQHPGWSDARVAAKVHVAASTVGRWRRQAGLGLAQKKVRGPRPKLSKTLQEASPRPRSDWQTPNLALDNARARER